MSTLFFTIIFIELFTILYNLIKFIIYKIKYKSNLKITNFQCNDNFHINVLIPCYKETKVIRKTLEHFKEIIKDVKTLMFMLLQLKKKKMKELWFKLLMSIY